MQEPRMPDFSGGMASADFQQMIEDITAEIVALLPPKVEFSMPIEFIKAVST